MKTTLIFIHALTMSIVSPLSIKPTSASARHTSGSFSGLIDSGRVSRKAFLSGLVSSLVVAPQVASAGIDVSGLTIESSVEGASNMNDLARSIQALDGSASARIRDLAPPPPPPPVLYKPAELPPLSSTFATYTQVTPPLVKSIPFSPLTRLTTFVSSRETSFRWGGVDLRAESMLLCLVSLLLTLYLQSPMRLATLVAAFLPTGCSWIKARTM